MSASLSDAGSSSGTLGRSRAEKLTTGTAGGASMARALAGAGATIACDGLGARAGTGSPTSLKGGSEKGGAGRESNNATAAGTLEAVASAETIE